MPKQLNLEIVTPGEQKFKSAADMVVVRAVGGEIGILPDHESCNIALDDGVLKIKTGDETKFMKIFGGVATISGNNVIVMTNDAEWTD